VNKNKIEMIVTGIFILLIVAAVIFLFFYQAPKGFIYQTF
jgi:hypothetical protein